MLRPLALAAVTLASLATGAGAQSLGEIRSLSFDGGIGATFGPDYMGADDYGTSPWIILRNGQINDATGEKQGLSILPSLDYHGKRDAGDHDDLTGMDDISAAGELGVRLNYVMGDVTGYGAVRKGLGGHHGVTGELGARFRNQPQDKLTLTTAAELRFGNGEFTDTYFGVSEGESLSSGYAPYDAGGGIYAARLSVEARYEFLPDTLLMGRFTYSRLLGDAADSPIVHERNQPTFSIGVARHLNFRF
ncbi:MipA/OmpV family protein [Paracoccus yeei]|jgi:outer membrane protein|uniref:Structural protein MipA n=1 Tax=Paracoccus yeei TaxID=147645 RepID=A0A2D2C4R2_9RHOB|nr:MipA/OmpV family protein [Paracoccus yeei]ATQ57477.1 structural protein MipA [Paracoccus yeei]